MSEQKPRVVSVGEAVIELVRGGDGRFGLGCSGDTFNVAVYLARAGIDSAFATALGDDPYSEAILALATAEGVASDLMLRMRGRLPGLAVIDTDTAGTHHRHDWRGEAPARELFELPDWGRVAEGMTKAKLVYFSGITLSLYSNNGIGRFLALMEMIRQQGVKVAFDGNFRPRGWRGDLSRARTVFMQALKRVDIALPAYDDEAVLWGEVLGAALSNIAAYQGYAAVSDPHGSLLSWTTIEKGGIIVNSAGTRFGDESTGYSAFTPKVMAEAAPRYAIFDQRMHDVAALEEEFVELADRGGFHSAETPQALAKLVAIDPAALAKTVADAQRAARGECADKLGRKDFGLGPLQQRLYACRIVPGLFHTQGGLAVDLDGRVLDTKGGPIPNLFAGGGAAGGLSGRSGAAGYASGNGLLSAIGLGRLAGLAAAAEVRGARC